MTTRSGRWRQLLGCLLLPGMLALGGCNIFSWTHDEGGSDDPETLLQDAEDALLDKDWDAALAAAEKGIKLDPKLDYPRLRYVATQAVLGGAGISLSSYFDAFTSPSKPAVAGADFPRLAGELLNLSLEELLAIAESCPQAVAFLAELIDGLETGQITPDDLLGIKFDVEVGFGVANLLTALITTLDEDQDLSNGFVKTAFVRIESNDAGYTFAYTGPGDANTFVRTQLLCPLWSQFCDALNGIYDAYRTATAPEGWPEDLTCTPAVVDAIPTNPPLDDGYIIGQMLDFVRDGLALLRQTYLGPGCP